MLDGLDRRTLSAELSHHRIVFARTLYCVGGGEGAQRDTTERKAVLRPVHVFNAEVICARRAGTVGFSLTRISELQIVEQIVHLQVTLWFHEPDAKLVLRFGVSVYIASSRRHGCTILEPEHPSLLIEILKVECFATFVWGWRSRMERCLAFQHARRKARQSAVDTAIESPFALQSSKGSARHIFALRCAREPCIVKVLYNRFCLGFIVTR